MYYRTDRASACVFELVQGLLPPYPTLVLNQITAPLANELKINLSFHGRGYFEEN